MRAVTSSAARWQGSTILALAIQIAFITFVLEGGVSCSAKDASIWEPDIDDVDPRLPELLDDNIRYANFTSPVQSTLHVYPYTLPDYHEASRRIVRNSLVAGLGGVVLLGGIAMMCTHLLSGYLFKNAVTPMYGHFDKSLLKTRIVRNSPAAVVGVGVAIIGLVIILTCLARRNVAAADRDFSKWEAQKLFQHLIYLNKDDEAVSGTPEPEESAVLDRNSDTEGVYIDGEASLNESHSGTEQSASDSNPESADPSPYPSYEENSAAASHSTLRQRERAKQV